MELDQLIPEKVTITKEIVTEKETRSIDLTIRPFSLEDEAWLKAAYPGDKLKEAFEQMDMSSISRIAFHQLEMGCKRDLMSIKFMDIDEDGQDIEVAKTGPQKFGMLIKGYPEQLDLLKALLKARGFSMPIIEELGEHIKEEAEGKYKAHDKK